MKYWDGYQLSRLVQHKGNAWNSNSIHYLKAAKGKFSFPLTRPYSRTRRRASQISSKPERYNKFSIERLKKFVLNRQKKTGVQGKTLYGLMDKFKDAIGELVLSKSALRRLSMGSSQRKNSQSTHFSICR